LNANRRWNVRGDPPPDRTAGRGLDGVIERADRLFNPDSEFLEGRAGSSSGSGAVMSDAEAGVAMVIGTVRGHHGDGRIKVSLTLLPAASGTEEGEGAAEGAAAQIADKQDGRG